MDRAFLLPYKWRDSSFVNLQGIDCVATMEAQDAGGGQGGEESVPLLLKASEKSPVRTSKFVKEFCFSVF